MDLEKARNIIDETDSKITELFKTRMDAVCEVAKYKKEHGLPIYNGQREREIINRLADSVPQDMSLYIRVLYNTLFNVSRAYQQKIISTKSSVVDEIDSALSNTDLIFPENATVACQGTEGAYSQKAAQRLFYNPTVKYFTDFRGVFEAVKNGECRYGILPIENSSYGSVREVYDLTEDYDFRIVRSAKIQIDHVLAAKNNDITRIMSHPQAIGQCGKFLKNFGADIVPCQNTAFAAKEASKTTGVGAICSKECAKIYGLEIIRENIADSDNNYTRFICISKNTEIYPGADKISLMITLPHISGSLSGLISKFAAAGMNLTKIESRPIVGKDFEFEFYFEMEVSVYSKELYPLLSELEANSEKFRFFGCFSEK